MNINAWAFFTRWLCRELVNMRLRPMFCRYREAERLGDIRRAERCELLFFTLLNRTDCYPFCIEVDRCGLWVLDEPSQEDFGSWEDCA